ncbi:hypothetical protein SLEP1_g35677 [Rubroshorea leprosula]|uniref:Uncharacterized protein n=1 Tax=Rubroshorea leprosula TaxID=152421 RepID=A0AAV5KNW1_9ROSI|nr:hypothetical protein SLEP1_g35677 [Rubroshorea leprosula]
MAKDGMKVKTRLVADLGLVVLEKMEVGEGQSEKMEVGAILEKMEVDAILILELIVNEGLVGEESLLLPRLETLTLEGLPKLTRFCSGNYFEFPFLRCLHIIKCPLLETFISSSNVGETSHMTESKIVESTFTSLLFDAKVGFPRLKHLVLKDMESLNLIWDNQLDAGSFHKLDQLLILASELLSYQRTCRENQLENHDQCPLFLINVTVMECPSIRTFSEGEVSTPKLQKVKLTENSTDEGIWQEGSLNRTLQQLFTKKSGDDGEEDWSDALHKLFN